MDIGIASAGFSAMGSQARLRVLQELVKAGPDGLAVGDIQSRTAIPASTLAHHLKFLRDAGLVTQEKVGRTIFNKARYEHLRILADFILDECCSLQPAASDDNKQTELVS